MNTTFFSKGNLLLPLLFCLAAAKMQAQQIQKIGFEVGIGCHAFYLPGIGNDIAGLQPYVTLGVFRALNKRQNLKALVSLGYQRNYYQGDGLFAQAQFQYNPLIFKKIDAAIGAGAGYQLAFYPSASLKFEDGKWVKGKAFKSVFQVPLRVSLGLRSKLTHYGQFTPFLAYQANVLFGYSPDLNPLPVSAFTLGLKFNPIQK